MKCRNVKCGQEFHRYFPVKEFELHQYTTGWGCFACGFPKMIVAKTDRVVKDGFKPGFQRNIRKHCATYAEYKAHLKNMGLVELGYEDLPEPKPGEQKFFTPEFCRKLNQKYGISLSDGDVEFLNKQEIPKPS